MTARPIGDVRHDHRPGDEVPGETARHDTVQPACRPPADAGMSTVEYAIGTVVAAAFAAILYQIVTGDSVVAGLTALIQSALTPAF